MSTRKYPPQLHLGIFSGEVFCATRFHKTKDGYMVADEQFDVTENFDAVAKERVRFKAAERREARKALIK